MEEQYKRKLQELRREKFMTFKEIIDKSKISPNALKRLISVFARDLCITKRGENQEKVYWSLDDLKDTPDLGVKVDATGQKKGTEDAGNIKAEKDIKENDKEGIHNLDYKVVQPLIDTEVKEDKEGTEVLDNMENKKKHKEDLQEKEHVELPSSTVKGNKIEKKEFTYKFKWNNDVQRERILKSMDCEVHLNRDSEEVSFNELVRRTGVHPMYLRRSLYHIAFSAQKPTP